MEPGISAEFVYTFHIADTDFENTLATIMLDARCNPSSLHRHFSCFERNFETGFLASHAVGAFSL